MSSSNHLRENTLAENYKNRTIPAFISLLKIYRDSLSRRSVHLPYHIFTRAVRSECFRSLEAYCVANRVCVTGLQACMLRSFLQALYSQDIDRPMRLLLTLPRPVTLQLIKYFTAKSVGRSTQLEGASRRYRMPSVSSGRCAHVTARHISLHGLSIQDPTAQACA